MQALLYTLAPVLAVVLGAIIASSTKLNPGLVAGLQHLAAGVVFAAAATEILPQVKHEASPSATLIGGAAGVVTMLGLKAFEARFEGPMALLAAIGIDIRSEEHTYELQSLMRTSYAVFCCKKKNKLQILSCSPYVEC